MAEEKTIDKIKKLFALAESEKAIGNDAAGDTIFQKAFELMTKYKLEHKDIIEEECTSDTDYVYYAPVMGKSLVVNPFLRVNARKVKRLFWFEELAKVVANALFCKASIDTRSCELFFYGLDMDREIAVLVFQKFAERANSICKSEMDRAKKVAGTKKIVFGQKSKSDETPIHPVWLGDEAFEDSFHKGFRETIAEHFSNSQDNSTSVESVNEYWRNNSSYYERDYEFESGSKPFEGDFIAIQIGQKYAKKVCKKIASTNGSGENDQSLQVKAKSSASFVGEVIILMDDSGSMTSPVGNYWERNSEKRVDQAKDGTLAFAEERIKDGHAVGLIKFGSEPTILLYPQLNIDKTFKIAVSKLDGSSGNTEMAKAITVATQSFKNHKIKRTICLVTDGEPSDREEAVFAAANEAKRIGIEIATVGCGGAREEFLKKLASRDGLGIIAENNDIRNGMKRIAGLLGG